VFHAHNLLSPNAARIIGQMNRNEPSAANKFTRSGCGFILGRNAAKSIRL
jgi:hypothetical protein